MPQVPLISVGENPGRAAAATSDPQPCPVWTALVQNILVFLLHSGSSCHHDWSRFTFEHVMGMRAAILVDCKICLNMQGVAT